MIDAHAHIHFSEFDQDRDEVIRRAREAGVSHILSIGTDIEESKKAIDCAERYEGVFASVGIHPHEYLLDTAKEERQRNEWIGELKTLVAHPKVRAIGECGLDYFSRNPEKPITDEEKDVQKEGFLVQKRLALESSLPMIIHCRPSIGTDDAYQDLYEMIREEGVGSEQAEQSLVLHCYVGDTEVTKKFLELPNVFFSFTGNITYPVKSSLRGTKDDLAKTVKDIPVDRMLTETDCPYLAPQTHRGSRNEPAYVTLVAEKIGEIKGISKEALEKTVEGTAQKVFKKMKI